MTAKELKNALLQEAVQGKLVPQIASEGDAKDLLEEIRKEKSKLVKEGKIKKEKPLPEITEDDIPFDIPENWCWCRLNEIAFSLTDGVHFAPKYLPNGIPCFSAKDIYDDKINLSKCNFISEKDYEMMREKINVKHNSILISKSGSIGRSAIIDEYFKFGLVESIGVINLISIIPQYIKVLLDYLFGQTFENEYTQGIAVKHLTLQLLASIKVPLPPLDEQKRIVAAIEKFMPLIEEYGKKETELKAFNEQIGTLTKKAILQEAVQGKLVPQIAAEGNAKDLLEEIKKEKAKLIKEGTIKKEKALPEITEDEIPFDIPESWCWCRLGELVDTNIGLTYSPSDIITSGGTEVLRSNNIQNGKIVYDDLVHVSKNVPEKCLSKKGDLLICARNGSKALVGKSALIEQDGMAFGAFMAIVRSPINPYILHFINSPVYRAKLDGVNTTTINQITQDNLRETLFPLPPLAEQKRIVEAIEKMLPLCEKLGE